MKISCVVLCCDSHIEKGFSVLHCLKSLVGQNIAREELQIILVENSHDKSRMSELEELVLSINNDYPELISLIDNKSSLPRAEARNVGASHARNEVLVFIDDDTIVLDVNALRKIQEYSQSYDHGYGAVRYWSRGNSFQDNACLALNDPTVYRSIDNRHIPQERFLAKTFIGNFGFCRRDSFMDVGGFYEFKEYGFEDDALMFALYKKDGRVKIIDDIDVLHVNHPVNRIESPNIDLYQELLIRNGIYWFHPLRLMYGAQNENVDALEVLGPIHYDEKVSDAYRRYKSLTPLDLTGDSSLRYKFWAENYQYGIMDFARKINILMGSDDIDQFVKNSESDFDNIAPLLESANTESLAKISGNGGVVVMYNYSRPEANKDQCIDITIPKAEINQFPCDLESRQRRIKFIRDRYPFVDYMRMGFIGDDDLVSAALKEDKWIWPVVFEKDEDITQVILRENPRAEIHVADVRDKNSSLDKKVATFLVDPPYTMHGALGFILTGLRMTDFDGAHDREFYAILNPTMMGQNLSALFSVLARCNITPVEIYKNFSAYKLPSNLAEIERAQSFLHGIGVNGTALRYSSASNLYIFRSRNPDMDTLADQVNWDKIYEHYQPS